MCVTARAPDAAHLGDSTAVHHEGLDRAGGGTPGVVVEAVERGEGLQLGVLRAGSAGQERYAVESIVGLSYFPL